MNSIYITSLFLVTLCQTANASHRTSGNVPDHGSLDPDDWEELDKYRVLSHSDFEDDERKDKTPPNSSTTNSSPPTTSTSSSTETSLSTSSTSITSDSSNPK